MTTTVRHNYTPQPEEAPSHVSILPYIPITLAAFIFSFALAIHQPPGPRRWACLPTILAGPALHTFAISRGLSPSFLLWIWTFTTSMSHLHWSIVSLVVSCRHTEAQDLVEQYLLQVQAADDPIAPAEGIPYEALAANDNCILAGAHPWQWYDDD